MDDRDRIKPILPPQNLIQSHYLQLMLMTLWVSIAGPALGWQRQDDTGVQEPLESLEALNVDLAPIVRGIDWDEESEFINRAIENVWRDFGWNDEGDRFALEVAHEVSRIPPWKMMDRLNLITDRVAKRYDLSDARKDGFRDLVLNEAGGLIMRNGKVLLSQAREAFATRMEGKPFTPDQVAQWTREAEPLIKDVNQTVERVTEQVMHITPASRRDLVRKDLESFRKRQRGLNVLAKKWIDGEWRPEDWGVQDDPYHREALDVQNIMPPDPREADEPPSGVGIDQVTQEKPIKHWVNHDPSTWIAFVDRLIKEGKMDPGQTTAARSIHEELYERAKSYIDGHHDTLALVKLGNRNKHPDFGPVRSVFEELHDRLLALLTTAQRQVLDPQLLGNKEVNDTPPQEPTDGFP